MLRTGTRNWRMRSRQCFCGADLIARKKIKKHVAKGISLKICLLKTIVCFKQICLLFIFRIPTCLVYSTSPLSSPKTTSFMELQDKYIFWKFFGGLPTDSNPLNSKKRIKKKIFPKWWFQMYQFHGRIQKNITNYAN